MNADIPKQYLSIHHKPLALYSFEVFLAMPEMEEMVVVCDPQYESLFMVNRGSKNITFASPGLRRQDSVYNGLQKLKSLNEDQLICIHDSVRPLIDTALVERVIQMAGQSKAAVAGIQVKSTIKLCDDAHNVVQTLDRSHLWEIQTPQAITLKLLKEGFKLVQEQNLTVTDDVSIVELMGKPVKVVEGSYTNIKVTTPEDLILVQQLLEKKCPATN